MKPKKQVALGLLGISLDAGHAARRWETWRPTVSLCQQEDLALDRLDLLCQIRHTKLAETVEKDIRAISPETEVRRHLIEFKDPWDFEEVYGALLDFARGYPFDVEKEDYLVHITTGTHVAQICLFLLTESRHLPGRLIQTSPPDRGEPNGPGRYDIIDLDLSKYDRIATRHQTERREGISFLKSGIETRNAEFNRLIEQIEHVAIHARDPILLTGPTGAGKSRLAQKIYELKKSRHQLTGRMVEANCATLRGEGAMSALFGHVKGAFTGAAQDRPGLLRTADKGLLFLDEIGELRLDEQAMLLRALEEKKFFPVGADREAESDFQLIAGTNRDLPEEVARGAFREDLLARINLWTFRLPGLRERPEDIEPNLLYELEQYSRKHGARVGFNKEAWQEFLAFAVSPEAAWKANFRDLNAAVVRMGTLAPGGRINAEVLRGEMTRLKSGWGARSGTGQGKHSLEKLVGKERADSMDLFDRLQLAGVVEVCQSSASLSDAGRALFAASRERKKNANDADRLRKYLARFGLSWEECRESLPRRRDRAAQIVG